MAKGFATHQLVHSFSKAEKRYFKRLVAFGAGRKESNATQLFDYLLSSPEYDEKKLLEHFQGHSIAEQLPVLISKLFDQLMRVLRMTRSHEDKIWVIRKELTDIAILFERKLYPECLKKVNKAIKICKKFENQTYLLELHGWKYRLMVQKGNKGMGAMIQENQ